MSNTRCQCLTVKGTQCLRKALPGSKYCLQHKNCSDPIEKLHKAKLPTAKLHPYGN